MEEDDDKELRERYDDQNIKANEYLYRRVDVEDVVSAHLLAIEKLDTIGFSKYIISTSSPFRQNDLDVLNSDAISVVKKIYPDFEETYLEKGWKMFPKIGRVYVNDKARKELGWNPKYDFQNVLSCIRKGNDFRSRLSLHVGSKGYHKEKFSEGPYPI
jgi:nucleoside-diphosphate-sugar epimerase